MVVGRHHVKAQAGTKPSNPAANAQPIHTALPATVCAAVGSVLACSVMSTATLHPPRGRSRGKETPNPSKATDPRPASLGEAGFGVTTLDKTVS